MLGVITFAALITQTEAAIFLRAGLLLVVWLVLWALNRAVVGKTNELRAAELGG